MSDSIGGLSTVWSDDSSLVDRGYRRPASVFVSELPFVSAKSPLVDRQADHVTSVEVNIQSTHGVSRQTGR